MRTRLCRIAPKRVVGAQKAPTRGERRGRVLLMGDTSREALRASCTQPPPGCPVPSWPKDASVGDHRRLIRKLVEQTMRGQVVLGSRQLDSHNLAALRVDKPAQGLPMTTTSDVTDLATATATEVVDAARAQYENVLAAIRRNPLQATGIAAGIGFALALLARGSRKSPT